MRFNRKIFWREYRKQFEEYLAQQTVDGLNYFLDRFETETRLKTIPEFSYVLATAYHETGKLRLIENAKRIVRFQPVSEARERSGSPRRANQDRYWNTGFYGRGFPQTTHEKNYLESGRVLGLGDKFVKNPDLLLQPQYAYDAMIICMVKGVYTGKKLADYITKARKDYSGARRIINGTDKAALIASYAESFEQILKDSLSTDRQELASSNSLSKTAGNAVEIAGLIQTDSAQNISGISEKDGSHKTEPDAAQIMPPALPDSAPVEVEQVKPETQPEKQDWGIKASLAAAVTFITTSGAGVFAVMREAKTEIIYGFFGAATVVGIVFIITRFIYIAKKEKLESDEKMAREQRAADLQLALVESASRRDLNTVSVVPTKLENSDSPDDEPKMFARSGAGGSW